MKNNVREHKQNANEKETEAGDFLQQIRAQVSADCAVDSLCEKVMSRFLILLIIFVCNFEFLYFVTSNLIVDMWLQ